MKKRAFTLIEVTIVIAIIALLAAIIMGAITVARNSSKEGANRANGEAIRNALQSKYARRIRYTDVSGTPWGPWTFEQAIGAGFPLADYGVGLNTQGCTNGGGDVAALTDQSYRIRIFGVSGASPCSNLNIIETITGP